jgi:hypothetical protein
LFHSSNATSTYINYLFDIYTLSPFQLKCFLTTITAGPYRDGAHFLPLIGSQTAVLFDIQTGGAAEPVFADLKTRSRCDRDLAGPQGKVYGFTSRDIEPTLATASLSQP